MNKTKFMAIAAALAIGLAASFLPLRESWTWLEAQYWRLQLDVAGDDQVELIMGNIAGLDRAGIPILVQALGSKRENVAAVAKQELLQKLENRQNLSRREYNLQMQILAEALACQVDHFGPAARSDAADLATRILLQPITGGGLDSFKLLTATEKVLRAGPNGGEAIYDQAAESFARAGANTADPLASSQSSLSQSGDSNGRLNADAAALTGDETPIPVPKGADQADAQMAENQATQPGLLAAAEASHSARPLRQATETSHNTEGSETSPRANQSVKNNQQSKAADHVRSTAYHGSEGNNSRASFSLAGEEALDLLKRMQDGNETEAADAEAELLHRGFSARQLSLVGRLFDPNPAVRKELVEQLPGLQGVDAAPWLLRLCRDADAEVRLAAMTVLATSSDPAVLNEVEQISQSDPDSAVRRIAERIKLQRKTLR